MKRYVYTLDASDCAGLCDDDMGASEGCALDGLADKQFLARAMLCLKAREERVVRLRYGIGGLGEHTYREIGDDLGTTVEHARQIHLKSLRKLRWHAKRFDPARFIEEKAISPSPPLPSCHEERRDLVPTASPRSATPRHRRTPTQSRIRPSSPVFSERPPVRTYQGRELGLSGLALAMIIGGFLVAIAFDTTTIFTLGRAFGVVVALTLPALALCSDVFTVMIAWGSYADSQPLFARLPRSVGMVLLIAFCTATTVACCSVSFFRFLLDSVAAAPPALKSPMPTIVPVAVCSSAIVSACRLSALVLHEH